MIGVNFLAPVGSVRVVGPFTGGSFTCKFGAPCVIKGIGGVGLRGDDRVIVSPTEDCSVDAIDLYDRVLREYGQTLETIASSTLWYDAGNDFPDMHQAWYSRSGMPGVEAPPAHSIEGPVAARISVPGFPGDGRSSPTQVEGKYSWGESGSVWPLVAGQYSLCWCGGGLPCLNQRHFNVHLGKLEVFGGFSLPPTRLQAASCVVYEKCVVRGLLGRLYPGDRIMITRGGCGAGFRPVGNGAPNRGVSLPSPNGRDYDFAEPAGSSGGEEADILTLAGGRYFLCLCSSRLSPNSCLTSQAGSSQAASGSASVRSSTSTESASYDSLAAVLLVKSPKVLTQAFFCLANRPCTIGPLEGYGLGATDRIKVAASCAAGTAGISGFPNGAIGTPTTEEGTYYSWGSDPLTAQVGQYRLCWAARSPAGTYNYIVDTGTISIAGPRPHQVKNCYDQLPCTVTGLQGTGMKDGDVLIALL
ncbi:hypothetical protein FOZ63_004592, partial [Perkinsus olseni]